MQEDIFQKEQCLIDPHMRVDEAQAIACLHPDFMEFGQSGTIHRYDDVVTYLETQKPSSYRIEDFHPVRLSETVIQATYRYITANSTTLRSSIWCFDAGVWRLRFHQGTVCP